MTHLALPLPDGWDFDPEFLNDARFLPTPVPASDCRLLGTGRRADEHDLEGLVRRAVTTAAVDAAPDLLRLHGCHPLVACDRGHRTAVLPECVVEMSEELLNRHLVCVGPPGVGKTSQFIAPAIAALLELRDTTTIVFDPKGDLFPMIAAQAKRAGRKRRDVVRLNLADPGGSVGWNPVPRGISRTDALALAWPLVMASESRSSNDSPFWRNVSVRLIAQILLALSHDPGETATLPRLQEILSLPRAALLPWLRDHGVHEFGSFLDSGSHNAETCLTDASMRLMAMLDEELCAVISHDELDLDRLFRRPTVLVVEMSEARIERQRPIFSLLVQQIFDRAIAVADRRADARLPFPVRVVIDEFASAIGAIPRLPTYLNTLRSRRVGILAAVQGLGQIRDLYGSAAESVSTGFSSKLFFPNVEVADAHYASQLSGMMTVEIGDPRNPDRPIQLCSRPVYMPDEIVRPPEHPALGRPVTLMIADRLPFQAYLAPSFRLPDLADLVRRGGRRRTGRSRRKTPLTYTPHGTQPVAASAAGAVFTNTTGWSDAQFRIKIAEVERGLAFDAATPSARKWWESFRDENEHRLDLVVRLGEELLQRKSSVSEFFLSHVYSNCDNIQANLHYLDYTRLKRREEADRKKATRRKGDATNELE